MANLDKACEQMMNILNVNPDLGKKWYKLPNWLKEGELIVRNSYDWHSSKRTGIMVENIRGMIVDFRLLGVIGNDTRYRMFDRGNGSNVKGDLLVSFTLLTNDNKFEYWFVSAKSWRKIINNTKKGYKLSHNFKALKWNGMLRDWEGDSIVGHFNATYTEQTEIFNLLENSTVGDSCWWDGNPSVFASR